MHFAHFFNTCKLLGERGCSLCNPIFINTPVREWMWSIILGADVDVSAGDLSLETLLVVTSRDRWLEININYRAVIQRVRRDGAGKESNGGRSLAEERYSKERGCTKGNEVVARARYMNFYTLVNWCAPRRSIRSADLPLVTFRRSGLVPRTARTICLHLARHFFSFASSCVAEQAPPAPSRSLCSISGRDDAVDVAHASPLSLL